MIFFGAAAAKPNALIVTVDDMSFDSVGAFGCALVGRRLISTVSRPPALATC
jgi:arylsulfatase A-like enzyme